MTPNPPSTAAALSRLLGPLRRAVLRATRSAADLPDLADPHIEMLRVVADQPGISPNAIATQLRLARPTVSNSMQALRHAGLITVRHSEADSRRVHVSLTATAKHLLARYDAVSEEILTAALAKLTRSERAAVAAALPALSKLQLTLTS